MSATEKALDHLREEMEQAAESATSEPDATNALSRHGLVAANNLCRTAANLGAELATALSCAQADETSSETAALIEAIQNVLGAISKIVLIAQEGCGRVLAELEIEGDSTGAELDYGDEDGAAA